jgi:hypothetical protein
MKKRLPMMAPGWISIPVKKRLAWEMTRSKIFVYKIHGLFGATKWHGDRSRLRSLPDNFVLLDLVQK